MKTNTMSMCNVHLGQCVTSDLSAHCDPWSVPVYDEPCEGFTRWHFRILCSSGQNKVPVGVATVCDPHLLTIQDILISLLHGSGFDSCDIWASPWLCYTICLYTEDRCKVKYKMNTLTNPPPDFSHLTCSNFHDEWIQILFQWLWKVSNMH